MRSVSVLEPPLSSPNVQTDDLLVMWQHPDTREIVPIGRFARRGARYSFTYTAGAAEIVGFRPLPGLNDLHRRYESDQIPAVFDQRIMSSERADYPEYIGTIGLTTATPWEQIVESGGRRAGDTLQFMPLPTASGGRAHARFLANGVSHIPEAPRRLSDREVCVTREQQESALQSLRVGDRIRLEPEVDNPQDPSAVLLTAGGVPVGWVPRALSKSVRELIGVAPLEAMVYRVNGPSAPFHLRLALDLDTPAPAGFVFDREGGWEPLAAQ
jgi:hypothetical protein